MTLNPLTFPLAIESANEHLLDALGDNYGGPTAAATLLRALTVDGVLVEGVAHYRPWATAVRLIKYNTEYEVGGSLAARIDRKIQELEMRQLEADRQAGILGILGLQDEVGRLNQVLGQIGPVDTESYF